MLRGIRLAHVGGVAGAFHLRWGSKYVLASEGGNAKPKRGSCGR